MKLKKINEEHYVVVDETEIKEGDWMYNPEREPSLLQCIGKGSIRGWKKITHSTQPIEQYYGATDGTIPFVYHKINELPLSEVKELLGEVDVEKKANEYFTETNPYHPEYNEGLHIGYKVGYKQALEDNKEKKYTEAQLIWAIQEAYGHGQNDEFDGVNKAEKSIIVITNYLHPKTEWEVDIINGKLTLI